MNQTSTPDTQISITIIRKRAVMDDDKITGKISANVSAKEVKKTLLDALRQSYGKDFEETEGLDLSV